MGEHTTDLVGDVEAAWCLHFLEIEKDCRPVRLADWGEYVAEEHRARFGWSADDLGSFCPELIAEQVEFLDAEDRRNYLNALHWMCDRHIVLYWDLPDAAPEERQRLIEDELYDIAPGSLALVSQVELAALEAGA